MARRLLVSARELAPDDHFHDAVIIDAVASQGRDELAVSQDGDAIRDRKHLIEIVRNENDRGALGFHRPHVMKQLSCFFRTQRRRRFVQNQQFHGPIHCARDFDKLALRDR